MTTEEIYRLNNPRNLGEWAFQGFPGRRKRIERARELANEGAQQRLAEQSSIEQMAEARALRYLQEQEKMARERAGIGAKLNQENALAQIRLQNELEGPMNKARITEAEARARAVEDAVTARQDEANSRAWNSVIRIANNQQEEQQPKVTATPDGRVIVTRGQNVTEFGQDDQGNRYTRPLMVDPNTARSFFDDSRGSYLPSRSDVSRPGAEQIVRPGDEHVPMAPAKSGGLFGGIGKMLGGGRQSGPVGGNEKMMANYDPRSAGEFAPTAPISPLGLAGQNAAGVIGDVLGKLSMRRPHGSAPVVTNPLASVATEFGVPAGDEASMATGIYQNLDQPYRGGAIRQFLKRNLSNDPEASAPYDINRQVARRARAFSTLQDLYR